MRAAGFRSPLRHGTASLLLLAALFGAALAGCAQRDDVHGDATRHDDHHGTDSTANVLDDARPPHGSTAAPGSTDGTPAATAGEADRVHIDPGMLRDLRITTTAVESRAAGAAVEMLGELHVDEDRYAEVGTPIPARVVAVHAAPGQRVARGDVLIELESPDLGKARAAYQRAQARAALAQQTLARQKDLAAQRIVATRRVQEAQAAATEADAALRAAAAELHALGSDPREAAPEPSAASRFALRAPLDGVVIERAAIHGQLAEPARPLVRVGELSQLWLVAHAFERDAVRIAPGSEARVKLTALPGRELAGTVTLVGSSVEAASRTIPVRITVANADGVLRPGMSATARVALADPGGSILSVPAAALQRLADGWSVFLPVAESVFAIRPVGRGRDLGGEVEIVSGLRPGERVVVEGAFLLKAEAEKTRGAGAAHAH